MAKLPNFKLVISDYCKLQITAHILIRGNILQVNIAAPVSWHATAATVKFSPFWVLNQPFERFDVVRHVRHVV